MLKPSMLGKTNVFLVGPMGSGKTAVGRYLARLLDLTFHDSDAEIERRTGVDIPFIFEKEGEAGFRQREREAIEILTAMDRIVLATGGGAVLLPENRGHLADRGCVVYLETSVTQQVERVKQGRTRPLLSNVDRRPNFRSSWPRERRSTARSPMSSFRLTGGRFAASQRTSCVSWAPGRCGKKRRPPARSMHKHVYCRADHARLPRRRAVT